MTIPFKIKEYIWLVDTIRNARRITFSEIQRKWLNTDMSEGVGLTRSTFNRHRDAILEMFGIIISCDRQNGYCYYIENVEVLEEDTVQNWLLSTLSVGNIISESLSLYNRILLEPVQSENHYLEMVLDAMKKCVKIAVDYRKYGRDSSKHLIFEPYCIKLFRQRWYVLGHFHYEAKDDKPELDFFGLFSFDRVLDMSLTEETFVVGPDFDAQAYFDDVWGVLTNDDTAMETVIVRAYGHERFYLRDLPLHKSQREIGRGEDFADFELHLRPTVDFSAHLLSRGGWLKVLSPQWLADEIHQMHIDAAAIYEVKNS